MENLLRILDLEPFGGFSFFHLPLLHFLLPLGHSL